jgi:hypothetical protein
VSWYLGPGALASWWIQELQRPGGSRSCYVLVAWSRTYCVLVDLGAAMSLLVGPEAAVF